MHQLKPRLTSEDSLQEKQVYRLDPLPARRANGAGLYSNAFPRLSPVSRTKYLSGRIIFAFANAADNACPFADFTVAETQCRNFTGFRYVLPHVFNLHFLWFDYIQCRLTSQHQFRYNCYS